MCIRDSRKGRQQEVTGLVVNDKLGVDRATLRRFRALLHALDKDGPAGKSWGASPDVFASATGFASYVAMVDAEKGRALLARVREITTTHGWTPPPRGPGGGVKPATAQDATSPVATASAPNPNVETPAPSAPPPAAKSAPAPPPEAPAKKKWWKLF